MSLPNDLNTVIQTLTNRGYNITSVFDIGANKGTWTAGFAPKMRGAEFFLFEANPKHHRPTSLAPKHKWFNSALSSPDIKEVEFFTSGGAKRGTGDSYYKEQTHVYDGGESIKLKTTTLDEMVKENSLPYPQLMKMDTQGSELDILKGAEKTIKHVDIIVVETPILPYNSGAPTFDDYINTLSDNGFVPVGVEGIIFANSLLVQIDLVFLKRNINTKYYGDNHLFTEGFNV